MAINAHAAPVAVRLPPLNITNILPHIAEVRLILSGFILTRTRRVRFNPSKNQPLSFYIPMHVQSHAHRMTYFITPLCPAATEQPHILDFHQPILLLRF